MAASIGLQSKELGRDGSLPLQDHHRSTTLRSEFAQSAQRGKDRLQCAQSNDKFGYASLRSEEVTGGSKMTARIAVHSRTNAPSDASVLVDEGGLAEILRRTMDVISNKPS